MKANRQRHARAPAGKWSIRQFLRVEQVQFARPGLEVERGANQPALIFAAGAQTHRSWWAARSAIAFSQRGDGRATLTLVGGKEVPVSRTFYKAISADGWLN